ncbi:MAG: hypothetical protein U0401_01275 [Anaerolineae bacterium]
MKLSTWVGHASVNGRLCRDYVEKLVGKKAILSTPPAPPSEPKITFANIDKARRLLDYSPNSGGGWTGPLVGLVSERSHTRMKKYAHLLIISVLSLVTIFGLLRLGNIDISSETLRRVHQGFGWG